MVYKTAPELSVIEEGRCLRVLGAPCGWWKMLVRVLAPAVAQIQDLGIDDPVVEAVPKSFKNKNKNVTHPGHGPISEGLWVGTLFSLFPFHDLPLK